VRVRVRVHERGGEGGGWKGETLLGNNKVTRKSTEQLKIMLLNERERERERQRFY